MGGACGFFSNFPVVLFLASFHWLSLFSTALLNTLLLNTFWDDFDLIKITAATFPCSSWFLLIFNSRFEIHASVKRSNATCNYVAHFRLKTCCSCWVFKGIACHRSQMKKASVKEKQQDRCQTSYPTFPTPRLSQVAHTSTLSLCKQPRVRMLIQFLLHHGSIDSQVTCRVPSAKYSFLFHQNLPRGTSAPQATAVQSWKNTSVSRGRKKSVCVQLAVPKPARHYLYLAFECWNMLYLNQQLKPTLMQQWS